MADNQSQPSQPQPPEQKTEVHIHNEAQGTKSPKDKIVAGILAILLGGLGVHKFYLGNIGLGIIYLCLSFTMIPSFIGLVEGIIYLTMDDDAFHAKYG